MRDTAFLCVRVCLCVRECRSRCVVCVVIVCAHMLCLCGECETAYIGSQIPLHGLCVKAFGTKYSTKSVSVPLTLLQSSVVTHGRVARQIWDSKRCGCRIWKCAAVLDQ